MRSLLPHAGWIWLHRWSSLVCTAFLLLLCLTGLPLIFLHDIYEPIYGDPTPRQSLPSLPAGTPRLDLDQIVQKALAHMPPGSAVEYILPIDSQEPLLKIGLEPPEGAGTDDVRLEVDARTGQILADSRHAQRDRAKKEQRGPNFLNIMAQLHISLMTGLPGSLLLCFMGVLFVLSLISGAVLYGPFMRKLAFATIRRERGPRIRWLDWHNLLGVATLSWLLVVGVTGVMHTVEDLLNDHWEETMKRAIAQVDQGRQVPTPATYSSPEEALRTVRVAVGPQREIISLLYPQRNPVSPYYYWFWTKGRTPLTSHVFMPVLVDVESGRLVSAKPFPWYLQALNIARPLHLGDYGGMPLKLIWAVLDIIAIIVIGSGLYLFVARGRKGHAPVMTTSPTSTEGRGR